jgi:DNA-binding GntR family transcriptional regulator
MDELVYRGYLRRMPNKGFEIRSRRPERPSRLTRHHLSFFTLAHRHRLLTRSEAIPGACGVFAARQLARANAQLLAGLRPAPDDSVQVLCRLRETRTRPRGPWTVVAVERTAVPTALLPSFLEDALGGIRRRGDFSVLRYLERAFPNDDFFKADYEISLARLPPDLAPYWESPTPPMSVVNVTYGTAGAIECTQTWFDPRRAVLLAGSLDVRVG